MTDDGIEPARELILLDSRVATDDVTNNLQIRQARMRIIFNRPRKY